MYVDYLCFMYRLMILLCVLGASGNLLGQSGYRFKNISVSDGLSQNTVTVVYEDSRGFMWLGTQDGLNRFDGTDFKIYRNNSDSSSLSDNFITAITEDLNGNMWIGTRSGLNRLDPCSGLCIRFPKVSRDTFHSTVGFLVCLSDGRILSNEIGKLNIISPLALDYSDSESIDIELATAVQFETSLLLIDKNGNTIQEPKGLSEVDRVLTNALGARYHNQALLVWNDDTLQVKKNGTTTNIGVPSKIRDAIFFKGQLWIATANELYVYSNKLEVVSPNLPESPTLRFSGDDIHSFVIDSFDQLWFGTNRHGAFMLPQHSTNFVHLNGQLFDDPIVWSAALVDSSLFIGTTAGVELYTWHNYPKINPFNPFENLEKTQSWNGFHASSLYHFKGNVYAGTRDGRVLEFSKSEEQWVLGDNPLATNFPQIFCITSDGNKLLASTSGGLFESTDLLNFTPLYPKDAEKRAKAYLLHVSVDNYHKYALSTTNGLRILDTKNNTEENIPFSTSTGGLGFAVVGSTLPTQDKLFISTMGRGIDCMDEQGNIRHWTADDGLRNEVVYGAVENNHGDIWFCTNDGLSVLSDNRIAVNYSIPEGIPFTEHSQNAFGRFDNHMWFGGINGMYLVDRNFQIQAPQRRLLVNEILINNKTIEVKSKHLEGSCFDPKKISLFPADNSLIFDFALLSVGGQTERLAYRLDGVDQDWIVVNNNKQRIQYTTLPSGNHTLEVVTLNFEGQVQSSLLKLPIEVHPPFWQTLWFAILVAIVFILAVVFIIRAVARRRIMEQLRKEETLRKIQDERERISMDLHDNIGAQITHVITSLDNLSYKIGIGQQVNTIPAIDELGDFARGTMQQLRDTIWTLKKDDVYLVEFIDRIQDYYRRVFQDQEDLHLHVVNAVKDQIQLPAETTVHLFRIMQEVATNALKHANATSFSVHFTEENQHLIIEIEDNGKGFDVEVVPPGHYGLKNIAARVSELSGSLNIHSGAGKTNIRLEIPIRLFHAS